LYRIKAKPGFNLVFSKESNIPSLNSSNSEWRYIEDDVFNNSSEIKRVFNFLIYEKVESIEVEDDSKTKIDNRVINLSDNVFVHSGNNVANEPDQITTFAIKAPEDVELTFNEPIIEETTKEAEEILEEVVEEVITEATEQEVEETITEEVVENTDKVVEVKKRGKKSKN